MRLGWEHTPRAIVDAFEAWAGAPIANVRTQATGFSPGVAARLELASGRRVFVKAIGPDPNPDSPAFHRREAEICAALPAAAPAPRLLWTHDDGAWVALAFEDIDGVHPTWRDGEIDRVLATLREMAALLTPSPIATRRVSELVAREIKGWGELAAAPPPGLDDWSRAHLDRLVTLEAAAPAAVDGDTLIHFDLRADNLLLTEDRVYVIDWPHAAVGAAWVDVVGFAPSVAMQGGPPPRELLAGYRVDPDALTAMIATLAGFFTARSLAPPPPGLPTLRPFQAAQAAVARAWLAERI